ncbi:MAG: GNAT family N-acetyltransferase [Candidatus Limnocylindrales bacterium]
MSDLRPTSPIRRPEDARPRTAAEHAHDSASETRHADAHGIAPPPSVAPITLEELSSVQRDLVSLPVHAGATITDDPELGVLRVRLPGGGAVMDYAALPRWESRGWQASLDLVTERMRAEGTWPSLIVADRLDKPPGLDRALRSLGWRRISAESTQWVAHASVVPHLDPALRFEAVQPRTVADHEELERRVFGADPTRAEARRAELATALAGGRLRAWVLRLQGEAIAVARLSQGDGVAGIHGLGVAREWRGQGYGSLLATVATRAGMATGNRIVWLSVDETNDVALHVYRKLGFQHAFGWSRWLAPVD